MAPLTIMLMGQRHVTITVCVDLMRTDEQFDVTNINILAYFLLNASSGSSQS